MKTGASSTKKESRELANAKQVVNAAAVYISQWTERELQTITKNERMPYIWPIEGVGYVIGHYRVLNNKGIWQVRDKDNKLLYSFTEKLVAVFYVLCDLTRRYNTARNLRLSDETVNRLRNDLVHYESSVKRAKTSKNYESLDIWLARLHETNLQLRAANRELQKTLNSAKYIKYWE
jgi:hypothetical protein